MVCKESYIEKANNVTMTLLLKRFLSPQTSRLNNIEINKKSKIILQNIYSWVMAQQGSSAKLEEDEAICK